MSQETIVATILTIVGLLTAGLVVRFVIKRKSNSTRTTIKNSRAGGDIAGRDIRKS